MSNAIIVCSNLSFSWPDDTPVFRELSCAIGGGRTGVVAPNGGGKRTLLRLIAGACRPGGGTVTVPRGARLPAAGPAAGRRPDRGRGAGLLGDQALDAIESGDRARSISPRSATTGTSRSAPGPSWTGSASATSPSPAPAHPQRRPGRLPRPGGTAAAGGPTCCCSTNRPTIWTSRRATSSTARSRTGPAACCWSATTGHCWTGWTASPSSTGVSSAPTAGTSPSQAGRARAREVAEKNIRTPSRRSSGRSGRCSRPANGHTTGRQRRPQPQERRTAEDRRRDDEARRPGVGRQVERDARRAGRGGQGPTRRGRRALRDDDDRAGTARDQVPAGRTVFLGERMQARYGERALFADGGST